MSEQIDSTRYGRFESADRGLRRSMSLTQLLFLGVSAQVGSGWLFAVLAAAGVAGPAAILSWIIASILIGFIALSYAETASMFPRSGAIVRYTYLSHGSFAGWIIGWAYWLSAVSIPPIEAEATLTYFGGKFQALHLIETRSGVVVLTWPQGIIGGVILMAAFFALNFFGAKLLSESNRWVTIWKLVIPTLTFCFLFAILNGSNFHTYGGFMPRGIAPIFHAIATSGVIFSLLGFRQSLDFGGEVRNPQRNVPLATWGCIAIPMVLYTLLQVAFVGAINWGDMGIKAGQWDKLASGAWADGPFFHALDSAGIAALAAFGSLLLADAVISPAGSGWVYLGTATRTGYGLGVHRNIPAIFRSNNRFGIPWAALVVSGVVGCVFFIPAPSWYQLVGFISAAAVLTYVVGGVGLQTLRRTAAGVPRPFRLRAAWFWAPIGFLSAMLIVYWAGFSTLANVFTATFIGLPLFAWYYAWKRRWLSPAVSVILGVVFLGVWIWIAHAGGWVLTTTGTQRPGGWSFAVYDIAFSAAIVIFCVLLWLFSNAEGRKHVKSTAWLIWLLLGSLPISYFGAYGPLTHAALPFPSGMAAEVALGITAYLWGERSGFETEEIRDIVEAYGEDQPGQAATPSS